MRDVPNSDNTPGYYKVNQITSYTILKFFLLTLLSLAFTSPLNTISKRGGTEALQDVQDSAQSKVQQKSPSPDNIVVLDLDETLIHSEEYKQNDPPKFDESLTQFSIQSNGQKFLVSVRPGFNKLVATLQKSYKLILWTASKQDYATKIMNGIDPRNIIRSRLYRQHCTPIGRSGLCSKNLQKFKLDMKHLVIVDDSALVQMWNENNAILIKPFYGEAGDSELDNLPKRIADKFEELQKAEKEKH